MPGTYISFDEAIHGLAGSRRDKVKARIDFLYMESGLFLNVYHCLKAEPRFPRDLWEALFDALLSTPEPPNAGEIQTALTTFFDLVRCVETRFRHPGPGSSAASSTSMYFVTSSIGITYSHLRR